MWATWINTENILLSEISQREKHYMIPFTWCVYNIIKFINSKRGMLVARGSWRGNGKLQIKRHRVSVK